MKSGSMRRSWLTGLTDAIVLLGVLACLPWPAAAQSDKKIPGMSLGTFKVTNSGGAKHTIPITVSPGINGMEPKLSIVYDSQVQNRLLGIGWTLAGIPAIHRCPRTIAQDNFKGNINLDANDRFCLDGQRSMAITSGTYGASGMEYRTELDTFVRVFSNGAIPAPGSGPLSFTVKNKAGETLEFGNTADSRIEAQGKTTVRIWALNKITDTNGNYMTVTYEEDTPNGDFRPSRIDYTGNAGQGVTPRRYVQFLYEARTDKSTLYLANSVVRTNKRLSTIQTYAPPPAGGAAVLVREYRLTYEYGTATGRTRLKTVTECATICLPPHTFNWQDGPNKFVSPAPQWTSALAIHDPDWDPSSFADRNYVGDFNGDGKADILSLETIGGTTVKVNLSTGTGFIIQTWAASIHSSRNRNHLGDFNGDGKTDILSYKNTTSCWLHLSTGSNFNKTSVPCNLNSDPSPDLNYVGDFNGDGKSDVAAWGNNQPFQVHLSTGTGFTVQNWPGATCVSETARNVAADFNGDGMTDIASSTGCVLLSTGTGFVTKSASGGMSRLGDYNGDGKADFVSNLAEVDLFTGTRFVRQQWTGEFNEDGIEYVGDFNGDGKWDVAVPTGSFCDIFASTGNDFILKSAACNVSTTDYTYIGDFNGDGKMDILQKTGDPTKSRVNLSFGPFPDLLTSITNNLGGKIDIIYKPITDTTVYTKDSDAVYPVMDVQAHIHRTPTYVVESHTARTRADGTGQNFTYTYDYGGAKWHHQGRGKLGFRWMRTVDETALVDQLNPGIKRQTTNFFNQSFPLIGLLKFSETADTQNPLLPFSQTSNTHTPISTVGSAVFPALTRVDKSECDKQPACLQTADEFTFDSHGNTILTRHLGDISDQNDQRDEVTEWIVDTANWIHRPKRTALLDSGGVTVREKWLYYDGLNLPSQWGQLGTPPRGLVTREESRAVSGTAGDRGQLGNPFFTYTHDGFGNRTSVNNPINCLTTTTFDTETRTFPATITNCLNHPPTVLTWDPRFGVKLTEQDPNHTPTNPVVTTYTYDTFGRLTKVTGPLDTTSQFGSISFNYNNWGNPTTQHIQSLTTKDHGTPTVIAREEFFDGLGRFYKNESDAPGGATITQRFTHDSRGLVTEKFAHRFLTEAELPPTKFVYDVLGRETFVIRPDGRTAETQYLPGRITLFDENDHQKVKILDGYGQVREIHEKNGLETYKTFYDYDAAGALVHVENHLHHHTRIKYDLLGRKIALCDPNMGAGPNVVLCDTSTSGAWRYTYDKAGNLLTQADAVLRSQNKVLTFQYDSLSRITTKIYPSGAGTITYTYDQGTNGIGRLSRVNDLGGVITAFTYDKMGRPTRIDRTIDGAPHTLTMTYNALSKVTNETFLDDNGYFAPFRPGISLHFGRLFRSIPATHFGAFRPPL